MTISVITYQPLTISDIPNLIEFDNLHLRDEMKNMGIPDPQLPPSLTFEELKKALDNKDYLEWIFFNGILAGYIWLEKKSDCIYGSGVAIKPEFYGIGLIQHTLNIAEQKAKENNLSICRLTAIPLNGRAVNVYLKYGYKIIACVQALFGEEYPEKFRFIMEKNIFEKENKNLIKEYEILCSDYKELKKSTDNGYIGIRLIKSKDQNNFENKICFAKYA